MENDSQDAAYPPRQKYAFRFVSFGPEEIEEECGSEDEGDEHASEDVVGAGTYVVVVVYFDLVIGNAWYRIVSILSITSGFAIGVYPLWIFLSIWM